MNCSGLPPALLIALGHMQTAQLGLAPCNNQYAPLQHGVLTQQQQQQQSGVPGLPERPGVLEHPQLQPAPNLPSAPTAPPLVPGGLGLILNQQQLLPCQNAQHAPRSTTPRTLTPVASWHSPAHVASPPVEAPPPEPDDAASDRAELRARAKQLLPMFAGNSAVDLDTCADFLEQCGGDLDACATQMLCMFGGTDDGCMGDIMQHPHELLTNAELKDTHLYATGPPSGPSAAHMEADAKLAAELHQQEQEEYEQSLRSKRVPQVIVVGSKRNTEPNSPIPTPPTPAADDHDAHLLLSPSDFFAASNGTFSNSPATIHQHAPAAQHSLEQALDDTILVEALQAEEQLHEKQTEKMRIEKLCKDGASKLHNFFPATDVAELESVLVAFEGDMTKAMEFMLNAMDEEARAQHQRLEEDQRFAQQLDQLESVKEKDTNSTIAGLGEDDLLQLMSNSPYSAVQEWHAGVSKVSSGSALFKASARLDALERGGGGRASGSGPTPPPPGNMDNSGQWYEAEEAASSPQMERGVAALQRAFGDQVDRSLLLDVLRNCHGHIKGAIVQLQHMGLEQVVRLDAGGCGMGHSSSASSCAVPASHASRACSSSTISSTTGSTTRPGSAQGYTGSSHAAANWLLQRMTPSAGGAGVRLTAERLAALNQVKQQKCKSTDEDTLSTISEDSESSAGQEDMDAFVHEFNRMRKHGHCLGDQEVHDSTQAMYQWLRAKSDRLKRRCWKLAAASREAYASGDRKTAGELAERRRALLLRVEAANEMAADRLYVWRNAARKSALVWDFHGLHVDEAIKKLDQSINAAKILPGRKQVEVITGRGNHSKGEPKLKLAVREFLESHRIPFEDGDGFMVITLEPTLDL